MRINAERERDFASRERDTAIQECNERVEKAEAARVDAVSKEQTAQDAKDKAEAQRDQDERVLAAIHATRAMPVESAGQQSAPAPEPSAVQPSAAAPDAQTVPLPSASDIANFVKAHLERMTGPAEGQLGDYAAEVDFHDKPNASLQAIEADRERWAQKWPRRIIFKDQVNPEIVFSKEPYFGWEATTVFNWQWVFWNQYGVMARGIYRDTWKIVPTAQGLKIISEHSVDAATGRSRD